MYSDTKLFTVLFCMKTLQQFTKLWWSKLLFLRMKVTGGAVVASPMPAYRLLQSPLTRDLGAQRGQIDERVKYA